MSLSSGTRLGPYEVVSAIGAGGMGEVYRARDIRLDRTVAIKILPAHLASNGDLRQRFEREARTLSSISHAHICPLYDIGRQDGVDFLVMEYLEGESLAKRLSRGPLSTREVLQMGADIADALDCAHRHNVVHRDLKPGNIMVTPAGPKLLDFGLAKPQRMDAAAAGSPAYSAATMSHSDHPITQAGTVVGTVQYMSPEQVQGGEADRRSDIFSFGAVLYEMATGKRAFEGKTQLSVASAILERDPEPVSTVHPTSPPALDHVIQTCLAKDPEERFQTARDIRLELNWIARGASSTTAISPVTQFVRRHGKRLTAGIAVAGWLVALVALVFALLYAQQLREADRSYSTDLNAPAGTDFQSVFYGPPVISPDGTKIAFTEIKNNTLWVRDLNSGRAQALAGTDDAMFPFWSPDSRSIGFFADGKLRRVDAAGGPVQTLCDAPEGRGGAWSTKGVIVFTPNIQEPLYRVPDGGGTPERVTQLDEHSTHRNPYFLPDGEHFLYVARNTASNAPADVYVGSLRGDKPFKLLEHGSNVQYSAGYLLFYRDTNLVAQKFSPDSLKLSGNVVPIAQGLDYWSPRDAAYFSASPGGVLVYRNSANVPVQAKWVDRSGKELETIGPPGFYNGLLLSPDGEKLAVDQGEPGTGRGDLWVIDIKRGTVSRATFTGAKQLTAAFSPTGDQVAVGGYGGSVPSLAWIQSVSGVGGQRPLVLPADTNATVANISNWSADGRYIFVDLQRNQTRFDISYIDLKGDRKLVDFLATPADESNAALSPNGKWLAYASDETGKPEVYVTAFPGPGGKWQISNSGGFLPHWSRDGKELYYQGGGKLFAVKIQNNDKFDFSTPEPLPIRVGRGWSEGPTPDRFIVLRRAEGTPGVPLHMIVNWPAQLKK